MRKSGLRDVKRQNRRLVIQTILDHASISRTEIAGETSLSPSTISSITAELLEEGLIRESPKKTSTAGRSRTGLEINPNRGSIAIVDITRTGVGLTVFDMALGEQENRSISPAPLTGNDLLESIETALRNCRDRADNSLAPLSGIGVLFEDDETAGESNVIYSTGYDSASIPLTEALKTVFRVPVLEDYTAGYVFAQTLGQNTKTAANRAHLSLFGATVAATVVLDGKPLPLNNGWCTGLTPLFSGCVHNLEGRQHTDSLEDTIGALVFLLGTLFPLDTILLTGDAARQEGFADRIGEAVRRIGGQAPRPRILVPPPVTSSGTNTLFAGRIRTAVLCA